MDNNVNYYSYKELKKMVEEYKNHKWIPCHIEDVYARITECEKTDW